MESRNINYIPQVDHLRLLAAALVFGFHVFHYYFGHWQPQPGRPAWGWLTEGHTGISLFFTLSGFIFMTIALRGGEIDYRQFVRNRFLRIFPLFLLIFFIAISLGRDEFRAADVFYTFFSNLGQSPTSNSFITGAAWTISVEFTFYLIFPFLGRFARQQGLAYLFRLLLILAVVRLAAYGVSPRPTQMFYSTLIGRLDQFLLGMAAAMLFDRHRALWNRRGRILLPLASVALFLALAVQARYASYFLPEQRQFFWVYWGVVEGALWGIFILAYLGARLPWPQLLDRGLTAAGAASYSLYLWHASVIYVVHKWLGPLSPFDSVLANTAVNALVLAPLVLGFALLSYHTIERPFLSLRGRYVTAVAEKAETAEKSRSCC